MFGLFKRKKSVRPVSRATFRPTLEPLEARTLLSAAGALDPTFGVAGKVIGSYTQQGANSGDGIDDVVLQTDGKIVAAGVDGGGHIVVARYNADGSVDKTFNGTGQRTLSIPGGGQTASCSLALALNGQLVMATTETTQTLVDGFPQELSSIIVVTRLNANGSLDTTFGAGGIVETRNADFLNADGVAVQADGKVVVVGNVAGQSFETAAIVLRYTTSGQLDGTFGAARTFHGTAADGNEGTTDSFRAGEVVIPDASNRSASCVAIEGDGKILVGGVCDASNAPDATTDFALARYDANGTLDPTFGTGGVVKTAFGNLTAAAASIALGPGGQIVLAGSAFAPHAPGDDADYALARYNSNGALDGAFGSGGRVLTNLHATETGATAAAVEPNGQVVAVGTAFSSGNAPVFDVLRYNANGKLDSFFGQSGQALTTFFKVGAEANAVALTPDGRIVVGGEVDDGSRIAFALARYLPGTAQPSLAYLAVSAPTQATAGTPFQFTITAIDINGHVYTAGVGTVVVTSSDGKAILPQAYTIKASDKGKHTFTITLRTRGRQTVTVSLENTAISSSFSVWVD